MKYAFAIFITLFLSACGSKLDATYSNNVTGVAEQKLSLTFKPDGTARMAIGSTKIPLEMPYEVSGNKIKVAGQKGDIIITVLENGDLLMEGLRLTKETASQTAQTSSVPKSTEQPAPAPSSSPATAPAPISEKAKPSRQATWSPSFDCAKASTFSEKAICTDTLLGKLDGALAENYKYMLASNIGDGAMNDLKASQRKWIAERNKCADNQCLANTYRKRIDEVCDYPVISGVHPVCTNSDEIK